MPSPYIDEQEFLGTKKPTIGGQSLQSKYIPEEEFVGDGAAKQQYIPENEFLGTTPARTITDTAKDTLVSGAKGVLGLGEAVVGLTDLATGGKAGKALEDTGIDTKAWQKSLSDQYSPAQQAANQKVDEASGFVDTAKAMIENPSTIYHSVVEAIPSMVGGGAVGAGIKYAGVKALPGVAAKLAPGTATMLGAAAGEGVVGAGSSAEAIRQETDDGLLTGGQAGLAALSGLGTAAFGAAGGRLAQKFGFADADTMLANAFNKTGKPGPNVAGGIVQETAKPRTFQDIGKAIVGGGISEGVFEELPQTIQEQIFQNAALDKPLMEGVPEGAANGLIVGAAMGSGANISSEIKKTFEPPPAATPQGPSPEERKAAIDAIRAANQPIEEITKLRGNPALQKQFGLIDDDVELLIKEHSMAAQVDTDFAGAPDTMKAGALAAIRAQTEAELLQKFQATSDKAYQDDLLDDMADSAIDLQAGEDAKLRGRKFDRMRAPKFIGKTKPEMLDLEDVEASQFGREALNQNQQRNQPKRQPTAEEIAYGQYTPDLPADAATRRGDDLVNEWTSDAVDLQQREDQKRMKGQPLALPQPAEKPGFEMLTPEEAAFRRAPAQGFEMVSPEESAKRVAAEDEAATKRGQSKVDTFFTGLLQNIDQAKQEGREPQNPAEKKLLGMDPLSFKTFEESAAPTKDAARQLASKKIAAIEQANYAGYITNEQAAEFEKEVVAQRKAWAPPAQRGIEAAPEVQDTRATGVSSTDESATTLGKTGHAPAFPLATGSYTTPKGKQLITITGDTAAHEEVIKSLPGAKWNSTKKAWTVAEENRVTLEKTLAGLVDRKHPKGPAEVEEETERDYRFKVKGQTGVIAIEKSALDLDDEQRSVERKFASQIAGDIDAAIVAYGKLPETKGGRLLNVDEARELSQDYAESKEGRGKHAKSTHEPSSFLIKEIIARKLDEDFAPNVPVLIMSGGGGVGKTTAAKTASTRLNDLYHNAEFILDGTFANEKSAKAKLKQILGAGRKVVISYTARDPFDSFANGSLPRAEDSGRTVPMDVSLADHRKAGEVFLALQDQFKGDDRVEFIVVDNTRGFGEAVEGSLDLIKTLDYNEIERRADDELERQLAEGKISRRVYDGTKSKRKADSQGSGRSVIQGAGTDDKGQSDRELEQGSISRRGPPESREPGTASQAVTPATPEPPSSASSTASIPQNEGGKVPANVQKKIDEKVYKVLGDGFSISGPNNSYPEWVITSPSGTTVGKGKTVDIALYEALNWKEGLVPQTLVENPQNVGGIPQNIGGKSTEEQIKALTDDNITSLFDEVDAEQSTGTSDKLWEKTLGEYLEENGIDPMSNRRSDKKDALVKEHRSAVRAAYEAGEDIPQKVKDDNPHLGRLDRKKEREAVEKKKAPVKKGQAVAKSKATPKKTAGTIAKDGGIAARKAAKDAIAGLTELFGAPNTLRSGLVFDEETYKKAKPHFVSAWLDVKDVGYSVKELVRYFYDAFGNKIRPYLEQFVRDVRDGNLETTQPPNENLTDTPQGDTIEGQGGGADGRQKQGDIPGTVREDGEAVETDGNRALGGLETEGGQAADEGGATPRGSAESGGESVSGDKGTGTGRIPKSRGGRGGNAKVYNSQTGEGGAGRTGEDSKPRVAPGNIPAVNFVITDEVGLGQGGETVKYNDNIAAIKTLKTLQREQRRATAEEQRTLARYVGWGGLANAFRNIETKEVKEGWEQRVAELEDLLTPEELAVARSSTRNAHYTSKAVIDGMWSALRHLGFKGGNALEPSVGTGNFIGLVPPELAGSTNFLAVEYENITAGIAAQLYPQATVLHSGFERVPIPDGSFDLVVGNPPFGKDKLTFPGNPHLSRHTIHNQFFLAGIDALRPGGIQAMVVSRFLLDSQDSTVRELLAKEANLLGVVRLPETAFKENARTEVITDIIFLQKKTEFERNPPSRYDEKGKEIPPPPYVAPSWVNTTSMPDPLGGDPITVNRYFAENPNAILGTMDRSGSMRFGADVTVKLPAGANIATLLEKRLRDILPKGIAAPPRPAEKAKEAHEAMVQNIEIVMNGFEDGNVLMSPTGILQQIIEKENANGDYILTKRDLTPDSAWSNSLILNSDGKWFREVDKLDANGNKVKDGNRNVKTRQVFENEKDLSGNMKLGDDGYRALKDAVVLLADLYEQIRLEITNAPEAQIEGHRKKLRKGYNGFVAEHGHLHAKKASRVIAGMPNSALLYSLEAKYKAPLTKERAAALGVKPRPAIVQPAAILNERVTFPYEAPERAESPADALAIVLSESGGVDLDRLAELLDTDTAGATRALHDDLDSPLIFFNPEVKRWETADEYLGGNVARKLEAAKQHNLGKNSLSLEKIQPEAWGADKITPIFGASWIPAQEYSAFISHITGSPATVRFNAHTNSFSVQGDFKGIKAQQWNTPERSIIDIAESVINSKPIKIYRTLSNGSREFQAEASELATAKGDELKLEFDEWVFQDSDRRHRLVELFNKKYNVRVLKQRDGSHLKLPGAVPFIEMRRHQKNGIWRGIADRTVLYDHSVGSGKTYTSIARVMERRRMGLSKKPMIVVPNHIVEQFAAAVYRLYPGAKVLTAGKADMSSSKRRRVFAKIATGDWDVVIVPHSSFGFIGIDPESEKRFLDEQLQLSLAAVEEAWDEAESDGYDRDKPKRKPHTVKEAERVLEKIKGKLDALKNRNDTRDRLLTFEQLGVDDLTVDEAHEFKNLFYNSSLSVRGMNPKQGSNKAYDLWTKVRILRESPTGSVAFMTGTPISNSAVEMYGLMRYLIPDMLAEAGLEHFDAWRNSFTTVSSGFEYTEAGTGLKEVSRLGRDWANMRMLMDMYYSFSDSVSNDDITKWYAEDHDGARYPLPNVKNGGRTPVVTPPTPAQRQILDDIIQGFDALPGEKDPKIRNANRLRLMDRARKLSLDARAVDPLSTSTEAGGKLEAVTENALRIYKDWTKDKGTQLIFLDRSIAKEKGHGKLLAEYDALIKKYTEADHAGNEEEARKIVDKLEKFDANTMEEIRVAQAGGWNAYQQLRDNLIAGGVPAHEIRFVGDADTDLKKKDLFEEVNAGTVRFLIGSTAKMGAGTNVQHRLVGLHHVDVGWKPSDIEQREGRIIRQGNDLYKKYGEKFEVEILAYVTENTIDAKMWALNSTKLKMINGIRNYKGEFNMEFEDEDAVGMAEIAALASGEPLQLEQVKLTTEIDRLERLKKAHRKQTFNAKDELENRQRQLEIIPKQLEVWERHEKDITAAYDAAMVEAAGWSININGVDYNRESLTDGTIETLLKQIKIDAIAAAEAKAEVVIDADGKETKKKRPPAIFAVEINGDKVRTIERAFSRVWEELGDGVLVMGELDGTKYKEKEKLARAIEAKVDAHTSEGNSEGELGTVTLNGTEVELSYQQIEQTDSEGKKGYETTIFFELDDKAKDGSRVVVAYGRDQTLSPSPTKMTSTWALNSRISDVAYSLKNLDSAISRHKGIDAYNKEAIPDLEKAANKPFAREQELTEKKARLKEVEDQLSNRAPHHQPTATTNDVGAGDTTPQAAQNPAENGKQVGQRSGQSSYIIISRENDIGETIKMPVVATMFTVQIDGKTFRFGLHKNPDGKGFQISEFYTGLAIDSDVDQKGRKDPEGAVKDILLNYGMMSGDKFESFLRTTLESKGQMNGEEGNVKFKSPAQAGATMPAMEVIGERTDARAKRDIAALSRAVNEARDGNKLTFTAVDVSTEATKRAQKIAGLFGKRVVFFQGSNPDDDPGGVTVRTAGNVLFVNVASGYSDMAIIGHELLHHLKAQHPDIYERLKGSILALVKESGVKDYQARLQRVYENTGTSKTVDIALAEEELIADFIGDRFTEASFWNDLSGAEPSLFRRVAKAIKTFLDDLLTKFRGIAGFKTDTLFNDLQAARKAAVTAIAEYSRREKAGQEITSADTSLRQVAAIFKKGLLKPGTRNVDIGGGKYDEGTNYLAGIGVENIVHDIFNRAGEYNDQSVRKLAAKMTDTATVNNVLNVIKEQWIRRDVVRQAAKAIKQDGTAYFQIHEGDADGKSRITKVVGGVARSWQNHQKTGWYMDDVATHFGTVTRKGNLIIAQDPKKYAAETWEDAEGKPVFTPTAGQSAAATIPPTLSELSPAMQAVAAEIKARMEARRVTARAGQQRKTVTSTRGQEILAKSMTGAGNVSKAKVTRRFQGYEEMVAKLQNEKIDAQEKVRLLADYVAKFPREVRGTIGMESFPARITAASSESRRMVLVRDALAKIDNAHEVYTKKTLLKEILDLIKKNAPQIKGNIARQTKGGYDLFSELRAIKRTLAMTEKEVGDRLNDLERKAAIDDLEFEDILELRRLTTYGRLLSASSVEAFQALQAIKSTIAGGKGAWQAEMDALRKRRSETKNEMVRVISGGRELKTETERIKDVQGMAKSYQWFKDALRAFDDKHQSFEWLLDKLSRFDKGSGILQSPLAKMFSPLVQRATVDEQTGTAAHMALLNEKMQEIFGLEGRALEKRLNKNSAIVDNTGVYRRDKGLRKEEIPLSQNMAYKRWMEWQDPTLREQLASQGYTETTMAEIEKFMEDDVMEWAKWQLTEFYPQYYGGVNEVFKKLFYTDMPHNPKYSPIKRTYAKGQEDQNLLMQENHYSSVINGSIRNRVDNHRDIELQDGDTALAVHLSQMEHFKAWAEPMRELRGTLGGERVRQAIKDFHGPAALKVLNGFLDDFARGKSAELVDTPMLQKFRGNFITAVLGVNPVVFLKQLTGIPAFAAEIPAGQWLKNLPKNPGEWIPIWKEMGKSEVLLARFGNGFERDLIAAMSSRVPGQMADTKKMSAKLMFFVRHGDKATAIIGGCPVYKYHYNKAIGEGKSEDQARAEAMEQFELAVERTQGSGNIKDMSAYQRGGEVARLFTMFMTAPNAFYRQMAAASRELQKSIALSKAAKEPGIEPTKAEEMRKEAAKMRMDAARRFVVIGIVLPVVFQFVAGAGFDDDDTLREIALGPMNGLFMLRDVATGVYDYSAGRPVFDSPGTPPPLSTLGEFHTAISKILKKWRSDEWLVDEDFWKIIKSVGTVAGNVTGLPVGPVARLGEGVYDAATGDTVNPALRALGYSEFRLDKANRDYLDLRQIGLARKETDPALYKAVAAQDERRTAMRKRLKTLQEKGANSEALSSARMKIKESNQAFVEKWGSRA